VPVRWVDIDDALVRRAASIKSRGGLSYADAFAAGAASSSPEAEGAVADRQYRRL
jgi:hypothetical protein